MAAGVVKVKGEKLSFNSYGDVAKLITGSLTGATPTGWNFKVKGTYLHWVDYAGDERRKEGTLTGESRAAGSVKVKGETILYGDISGDERSLVAVNTLILRPNGAGTYTNIPTQFPASGVHWDKVDEETADENTTYVENTGAAAYDTYALPASGLSGLTIVSVTIYARGKSIHGSAIETFQPILYTEGFLHWAGGIQSPEDTYTNKSREFTFNPETGIAWTWDEIDALEIGVRIGTPIGGGEVRCTQVWVEITYE